MTPLQNKSLFWDTDVRKLNPVAHKQYIIERILRFGDWEDYKWLRASYPEEEIKQVLLKERTELDPKSIHFWCQNFNIDEAICTKKLLAKTQELFWAR